MSDLSLASRIDGIVIGASAGGIDALSTLLPALPASMRAPVFIVLHLPRGRPSLLPEIFGPKCALRVCEADDKEPVAPGTVYFAPPDYHLLIDSGPCLSLSTDELVHFSRPSIDVLFESAVDVYGARLMGIILSGASDDGANGLAAIHDRGGVTIVQEPESAQSSLMVVAAMRRCAHHAVLSLDAIAARLRELGSTES